MPTVGFRYLTRFRCIGAECEDACCTQWAIPVDEAHYHALAARMAATPDERAEFAAALERDPAAARPDRFALMVLREDQRCAMLEDDRLCAIHRRYGEALLPDTCAIYPRSAGRLGDRLELTAAISCPEVARLCLLAGDAVELVALDDQVPARGHLHKILGAAPDEFERSFETVRAAVMRLFGDRRHPVATRLLALAVFAFRTAPLLRRDGARREPGTLEEALAQLGSTAALEELHQQRLAVDVSEPFAASVVSQVLLANRAGAPPAFARLVDAVLGETPDPAALLAAHRRRRAALDAATAARLEDIFHNYCVHYVFKEWYVKSPSLLGWTMGLLVRVAALRFLVINHPSLRGAAQLDAVAVEAFYTLSRVLEHDEAATRRIVRALEEQGMQTPAHALCLLQL